MFQFVMSFPHRLSFVSRFLIQVQFFSDFPSQDQFTFEALSGYLGNRVFISGNRGTKAKF